MITTVLDWLGSAALVLLAPSLAALALAIACAAAVYRWPSWLSTPLIAALITAAGIAYGYHAGGRSAAVRAEIGRLNAVIAEQARRRAAAERVAEAARKRAVEAVALAEDLNEQVTDYAASIAAAPEGACVSDPDYHRRMRAIAIGSAGHPASAAARRPDDPLP